VYFVTTAAYQGFPWLPLDQMRTFIGLLLLINLHKPSWNPWCTLLYFLKTHHYIQEKDYQDRTLQCHRTNIILIGTDMDALPGISLQNLRISLLFTFSVLYNLRLSVIVLGYGDKINIFIKSWSSLFPARKSNIFPANLYRWGNNPLPAVYWCLKTL